MSFSFRGTPALFATASLLMLLVVGCQNESEPGPEAGTDYYPLVVGDYRVFAVVDSVWVNYQLQPVNRFQFRERLTEKITDASGQPAYRLVRSRRTLPTDTWRDDSVMVIRADDKTLQLTRNNRRTVELVFPVRPEHSWNRDAFNSRDTIVAENRQYLRVGKVFETRANNQPVRYENTLTTEDVEAVAFDDGVFNVAKYRQVYAKGSGPVYRMRRRLAYCNGGTCDPDRIFQGQIRREALLEKGNTP
ncbi:hypothetical protein GCM10022408_20070 [Hymenobacter fastidiosus]|uniref:Lipoprotein n=1 Tax=Hymenobacter fastidiosus TaxID=486264 RepID=A0ABP7S7U2_9BACT